MENFQNYDCLTNFCILRYYPGIYVEELGIVQKP
jgi:hypothetical protein